MVIDPVCKMTINPATAVSTTFEGTQVYFCSATCLTRFLADPKAYEVDRSAQESAHTAHACLDDAGRSTHRLNWTSLAIGCGMGLIAATVLLAVYFGLLTILSGWRFTLDQFHDYWPFVIALAVGFGIQVGLFVILRRSVRESQSGKVVAVTGATSGAAMVSCCTHYLVNLLPALGVTGLVSFVGQYQTELFWFGIAVNLVGIAYMGRRTFAFIHGA